MFTVDNLRQGSDQKRRRQISGVGGIELHSQSLLRDVGCKLAGSSMSVVCKDRM